MKPNWRNPDDYPRVDGTTPGEWAWEFLRRNPAYIADWLAFRSGIGDYAGCYSTLTTPDMIALKRDPRYQHVNDKGMAIPLPYHAGRKWGLAQIADPDTPFDPLTHRWIRQADVLLFCEPWFDFSDEHYAMVAIDLTAPLDPQFVALRAYCKRSQSELRRTEKINPDGMRKRFDRYPLFLRALDGHADGASLVELAAVLLPHIDNTAANDYLGNQNVRYYLGKATEFLQGSYRRLPLISEK